MTQNIISSRKSH